MKTVKKIISSFLAVCLVFTLLPVSASAASTYNAGKALSYAASHWNDGKGLCAEFVSDCLKAGGLTSWNRECTNLFNQLNREVVSGAKIASIQYLNTSGNYIKVADNQGKISAGDVIFWLCNGCPRDRVGGPYQHTAIVSDVSGTYVNVYQHNKASNNKPAWVGTCYECGRRYSHMVAVHFAQNTPPTATLSIDRASTNYNLGDIVTFNFGGNNSGVYTLGIYKGSERIDTVTVYGNTYSRIFDEVAMYSAYMTAYNDYSYADSNWVGWQVNDLTANLSIDKTEIPQQGNITFTFGGNNVGTYANGDFTLGIYKDGVRTDTITVKGTTYTKAFSEPGSYKAYMTAFSGGGLADSNWVYWTVNPATRVIPEGDYVISPSGHSDYALDAAGGYSDAKTDIWLYQKNGTEAQTFSVVYVEGEWFKIVLKKNPQMCINVIGETRNGARLWLWPDDGTDSCYFRAIDCGDGTYKIQNKRGPDQRILDLSNDVAYNGAVVQLWDMHDTPAGRWRFTSVNIASGTTVDAPPIVRRGYIQF